MQINRNALFAATAICALASQPAMAEEGGLPTWGSANVNTAIVVSLGAGLATGIGGAVAFVPQIFASVKQGVILSVALAISAGVMLYVSFIEIFVKAQAEIEKSLGPSGAAATTTACFFAGMLFCVVLELLVHKCMGHGRAAHSLFPGPGTAQARVQAIGCGP